MPTLDEVISSEAYDLGFIEARAYFFYDGDAIPVSPYTSDTQEHIEYQCGVDVVVDAYLKSILEF